MALNRTGEDSDPTIQDHCKGFAVVSLLASMLLRYVHFCLKPGNWILRCGEASSTMALTELQRKQKAPNSQSQRRSHQ